MEAVCCHFCYSFIVTVLAVLYALFDVNYFLRIGFIIGVSRLFYKKKRVDETTKIYGICTSQDIDLVLTHMNNARYVRDLDFARFHFYDRTGIYKEIVKNKGHILQTASNIRYRRTIPLFTTYKITTKIIYWDDTTLYMEQQFITPRDGFIRAIVLSRQTVVGVSLQAIMAKLTGKAISYKPEPSEELLAWLSFTKKSSAKLRKKD